MKNQVRQALSGHKRREVWGPTPGEIEQSYETLGEELGLDGRCVVREETTRVVFEDAAGNQHLFQFATDPDIEW